MKKIIVILVFHIYIETVRTQAQDNYSTQGTEPSESSFRHAISSISDFFEPTRINKFFSEQGNEVKNVFDSVEKRFDEWGQNVDSYYQEQVQKIKDDLEYYLRTMEAQGEYIYGWHEQQDRNDTVNNPELNLTVPSIILRNGYKCETHTVISQGYLLNVHRITGRKNESRVHMKTILLHHGMFSSSAQWILAGPGNALAYVLSDHEYDVWMLNIRGNKYSREHSWKKPDSASYWNFTWHEIAFYDLPNVIDYIVSVKGQDAKISYIGHSMGTTILFAMLSVRPEYNSVLKMGLALGPVVYLTDIKSKMLKDLAPLANTIANLEYVRGTYEFAPKLFQCQGSNLERQFCNSISPYISGLNQTHFKNDIVPLIEAHAERATSWKIIVHYAQQIMSKRFQSFDYGSKNNAIYGSDLPPVYDLSNVTLPIMLFYSDNDILSSERDVRRLREAAPRAVKEVYIIPKTDFGHHDYLISIDAPTLLNIKILEVLNFSNFFFGAIP